MAAEQVPPGQPETPGVPDALPVLPLRDSVVLPLAAAPLAVGQPRSVQLVDDVMRGNRLLALVAQRDAAAESPGPSGLHDIGTMAVIHQLARAPDGTLRIFVQGLERIRIADWVRTEPYLVARAVAAPDTVDSGPELDGLRRAAVDLFHKLAGLIGELPADVAAAAEGLPDVRQVAYLIASIAPLDARARQEILALDPLSAKLRRLIDLLQRELAVRELGRKITTDTEERLSKRQREFYLREQLRSIQRELGEDEEGGGSETEDLRRRIEEAGLPEEARREADRELARLGSIPAASPEHGLIRTYLEWMASLPWGKLDGGVIDIAQARRVLDEDH
ncbi:MAG TPA: LON peptidase substrate-binding domain-containing protein, partial [Myxococcota bacterium]|nr:LON peptidase substrate-binding domain-containing protein [Myxococcota bacterium]